MTSTTGLIRVALVDDQHLVRSGLALVISSQHDLEVVGEASDGERALTAAASADVVLMDIRMPGVDGIEATRRIVQATDAAVIVLTTFDLDEYVVAAVRAGASGFLLKDAPPETLLAAIRAVHAGDAVMSPSATRALMERVTQHAPEQVADLPELTDREREVLTLMAQGLSNAEIAATLFLSESTVKTHVGRVLAKVGARDRAQAVIVAYEAGLVAPGRQHR